MTNISLWNNLDTQKRKYHNGGQKKNDRESEAYVMDIRFEKREHLKEKPDQKHLGFGKYMTDYMFVMDWTKEEGCLLYTSDAADE